MLSEDRVQELQGCSAERGLNTRQGISQIEGVETGSSGFIFFTSRTDFLRKKAWVF